MKLVGFVTGGAVAAVVVVGWSAISQVTDVERFEDMLTACVSYAQTGEAPFADQGRDVGVYDGPLFESGFTAGTHKLLEDARFEVAWETVTDEAQPVRVCRVSARFEGENQLDFDLQGTDVIALVSSTLAPFSDMQTETAEAPDRLSTLSWFEAGKSTSEGLRIVLVAGPNSVSSFFVASDLVD